MTAFYVLIGAALFIASSAHGAEIYKWIDESGRTHYSASKRDAENVKATTLKIDASPPPPLASAPSASSSGSSAVDRGRQLDQRPSRPTSPPMRPPAFEKPRSLSGGKAEETDIGKCNLARDVLSGSVKHTNGKPTDAYDRQVAENDIRMFCRR